MNIKLCPECQLENQTDAEICIYCGSMFGIDSEPAIKGCPYCGKEIEETAIICRYCTRYVGYEKTRHKEPKGGIPTREWAIVGAFVIIFLIAIILGFFGAYQLTDGYRSANATANSSRITEIAKNQETATQIAYQNTATDEAARQLATATRRGQQTAAVAAIATLTTQAESTSIAKQQAQQTTIAAAIATLTTRAETRAESTSAVQRQAQQATIAAANAMRTVWAAAEGTAKIQAKVDATEQALEGLEGYLAAITANQNLVYGPYNDQMVHDIDDYFEESPASPSYRNFIAEVRLFNPYAPSKGNWDYGLVFRDEGGNRYFLLIFRSSKEWSLTWHTDSGRGKDIHEGTIQNLNIGEDESNLIRLIVYEERGWLFVNGVFIAELFLSDPYSGDVHVVTGLFEGAELPGEMTKYESFTIWSIE